MNQIKIRPFSGFATGHCWKIKTLRFSWFLYIKKEYIEYYETDNLFIDNGRMKSIEYFDDFTGIYQPKDDIIESQDKALHFQRRNIWQETKFLQRHMLNLII